MLKRPAIQTERIYLLNFICFKTTTLKKLNYKKTAQPPSYRN